MSWQICVHAVKSVMILWPKFPDALVHRIFFVMQAYLTNGWRLSFTHAAAIMNFWEGMGLILPLFLQFLAETVLGDLAVASVSTLFSFTVSFYRMHLHKDPSISMIICD